MFSQLLISTQREHHAPYLSGKERLDGRLLWMQDPDLDHFVFLAGLKTRNLVPWRRKSAFEIKELPAARLTFPYAAREQADQGDDPSKAVKAVQAVASAPPPANRPMLVYTHYVSTTSACNLSPSPGCGCPSESITPVIGGGSSSTMPCKTASTPSPLLALMCLWIARGMPSDCSIWLETASGVACGRSILLITGSTSRERLRAMWKTDNVWAWMPSVRGPKGAGASGIRRAACDWIYTHGLRRQSG